MKALAGFIVIFFLLLALGFSGFLGLIGLIVLFAAVRSLMSR